jgi:hypothetical protein
VNKVKIAHKTAAKEIQESLAKVLKMKSAAELTAISVVLGKMISMKEELLNSFLVITELFLKGEITEISDGAYHTIETDVRGRLMFEFYSFFMQNKNAFQCVPETSMFLFYKENQEWCKIFIELAEDEKTYQITIQRYGKTQQFDDVFEALELLGEFIKA